MCKRVNPSMTAPINKPYIQVLSQLDPVIVQKGGRKIGAWDTRNRNYAY